MKLSGTHSASLKGPLPIAVVELHAGAQLHGDGLAIRRRRRDGLGEIGLNAEILVEAHEVAVDELEYARGGECRDLVRIEVGDLAGAREDERAALLRLIPTGR